MKKIILFSILLLSLNTSIIYSQPQIDWVRRYNSSDTISDYVVDARLDKAGNIYLTGYSEISDTSRCFLTIKYNYNGDFQWSRTYNCMGGSDKPAGMVLDKLGNVYVVGKIDTLNSLHHIMPCFKIIKYSDNGDILWTAKYVDEDSTIANPLSICIDDSSNIYVTGHCENSNPNGKSVTIKYNVNGQIQWIKFGPIINNYFYFNKIIFKNNFIYETGYSTNNQSNVVKYNLNGDTVWTASYQYGGKFISVDDFENVFVSGRDKISYYDIFRTNKYNINGILQWSRIHTDTSGYIFNNVISDMCVDRNNNVFVTGGGGSALGGNYLTIKYNSFGDSVWTRTYHVVYHSNEYAESIISDKSDNIYVTGRSDSNFLFTKFATVKYDSSGMLKWIVKYPVGLEFLSYYAKFIKLDTSGNIYIIGNADGYNTGMDLVIVKYSNNTGIKKIIGEIPDKYILFQNYPNPFNPTTTIKYALPKNEFVKLVIFDILGREIQTLINEKQSPGTYEITFNASQYPSGVYFYKLTTEGFSETKKMILLK